MGEPPLVVGVIGGFAGCGGRSPSVPFAQREFTSVDRDDFDRVIERCAPRLELTVPNRFDPDGDPLAVELDFADLDDFSPAAVARQVAPLRRLAAIRGEMAAVADGARPAAELTERLPRMRGDDPALGRLLRPLLGPTGATAPARPAGATTPPDDRSLLEQILDDAPAGAGAASDPADPIPDPVRDMVRNIVDELVDPQTVTRPGFTAAVRERITEIDAALAGQVGAILHHPEFQRLEASWRGLHRFVMRTTTGPELRIRMLLATAQELLADFRQAPDPSRSRLGQLVAPDRDRGVDPFGLLVLDELVGPDPEDIELLRAVSAVAAAAGAPALAGAGAGLLGLGSFTELPDANLDRCGPRDEAARALWESLRAAPEFRFLTLVLPRVLGRLPYGEDNPAEGFDLQEDATGLAHRDFLWGNPAYALAGCVTAGFAERGWDLSVRGPQQGGMVAGLPLHLIQGAQDSAATVGPTEAPIDDRRRQELKALGFVPLVSLAHQDAAAFFAVQLPLGEFR